MGIFPNPKGIEQSSWKQQVGVRVEPIRLQESQGLVRTNPICNFVALLRWKIEQQKALFVHSGNYRGGVGSGGENELREITDRTFVWEISRIDSGYVRSTDESRTGTTRATPFHTAAAPWFALIRQFAAGNQT